MDPRIAQDISHAGPGGDEPPDRDVAPAKSPLAGRLHDALVALNKTTRIRRMYPPSHQFVTRALADLHERLVAAAAAAEDGEARLDVGPSSLKHEETVVYTDERGPQNLPFRFYKDGIQSIAFRRGITVEEVTRFVDALHVDFEGHGRAGDDLAIGQWNADLKGISFFAVDELDPEATRGERDDDDDEAAESKHIETADLSSRVEGLLARLGEPTLSPSAAARAAGPGGRSAPARSFRRQISLTEREVLEAERDETLAPWEDRAGLVDGGAAEQRPAAMRAETGGDAEARAMSLCELRDEGDLPRRAIRVLRWLLERGELDHEADQVVELVWGLLGRYLDESRLDLLLNALGELKTGLGRASPRARAVYEKVMAGAAAPARVDAVVRLLNRRQADEESILRLLREGLPPEALTALASLFTKVRAEEGRAAVLKVLVERASESPELLGVIIRGDDADASREAMRALRAVGSSYSRGIALAGLESPDPDTRAEAIRAIPENELPLHDERLEARLSDPSPTVRALAARRLAIAGTVNALRALYGRLEKVPRDDVEERVNLLRAISIADTGGADILWAEAGPRPRRFGLLPPGELDRLRHDLVLALRSVPTAAARMYLTRCSQSEDAALRKLAQQSLSGATERTAFDGTDRVGGDGP